MPGPFDYQVFGLKIRSDFALPELFEAIDERAPDVSIGRGTIESPISAADIHKDGGALILPIPSVARYQIASGCEILVEPERGVPERNVRLFLLGSAFGALLHQRGLLPLHASAMDIGGRAVAFMGESGAGKSTLAAWFHDRGYPIIADDVCVIGFDDGGQPFAAPGLPRMRLWSEALHLTGRDHTGLTRSYLSDEEEKFDVPIDAASAARSPRPLTAIYLLERGAETCVVPLRGIEAADAIFANTYRGEYLPKTAGQKEHWEAAVRLVRGTPVFRAIRQWDPEVLDEQSSRLLDHARGLLPNQQEAAAGEPADQP